MASPEWAQSNSNLDAFVNVFSWFTAYGQASSSDAMAQGAANLNAVQQMMSESASYADKASAAMGRPPADGARAAGRPRAGGSSDPCEMRHQAAAGGL